jgi:hypothetical protein
MNNVRKEIRDLISINEKIQSALLSGDRISADEATLIRQCASELLEKIPAPKQWTRDGQVLDGQAMGEAAGDLAAP